MANKWQINKQNSTDLVEQLVHNRGITEPTEREKFLNPDWERDTHDPASFQQMEGAVNRVFDALQNVNKIIVHGDYDADGVCGTTVIFSTLELIHEKTPNMPDRLELEAFLPDREKDGYGVALHTVERFGQEQVNLLITVDCGIANALELGRAAELGIDTIICDHHQLAPELPESAYIIHPLAPGEAYPNKTLCGTGVAYKFATMLIREARRRGADIPDGYEKWLLDLVAIATVTDIMPLLGENRVLEKFGLQVLNKTRRPGLRKIIELSRSEFGSLDTEAIGFQIGPRLNAAGRIKSAEVAFKALSAKTSQEAERFANELEMLNRERQRISGNAYDEARQMVEQETATVHAHVVWSETWSPGIIGLVAGKLVTEFGLPAFVLTRVGEQYVGSGRSIGGMHLVEAMRSCGDIFVKSGGHPQACGMTLASLEKVVAFKQGVQKFAADYFTSTDSKQIIEIEAELPLDQINWDLYERLNQFQPFGQGNPKPRFIARNLQVISAEPIGKTGQHLRLTINPPQGHVWKMVGFNLGAWIKKLFMGQLVDVVYELGVNTWNGNTELQCQIVDLRMSE